MQWNHKIFEVKKEGFEALALEIFNFQYANNSIYRDYAQALHVEPASICSLEQIPFLPIRFFKSHAVTSTVFEPAAIFESSGTTGMNNSRHFVKDLSLYEQSFTRGFELFYGNIEDYIIFGLLPSYLERGNSSLVYMVNKLIELSKNEFSQFYLGDVNQMISRLRLLESRAGKPGKTPKKNLLIGVTYALLDIQEKQSHPWSHTIVMETGGMKGRRKEMIRQEVHEQLSQNFHVDLIHSEYGMTELLSQAYSKGKGIFYCPPWMKIMVRDDEDPLSVSRAASQPDTVLTGAVNIIDLANIYSCSFIASDDAAKIFPDGSFEITGRMDGSDMRGCSLMAAM